jgi:hypothetical protein
LFEMGSNQIAGIKEKHPDRKKPAVRMYLFLSQTGIIQWFTFQI